MYHSLSILGGVSACDGSCQNVAWLPLKMKVREIVLCALDGIESLCDELKHIHVSIRTLLKQTKAGDAPILRYYHILIVSHWKSFQWLERMENT